MIIVDTNILAYLIFSTPNSAAVTSLYNQNQEWGAPMLWRSEFLNVLALYYRKSLITEEESTAAIQYGQRLIGSNEHHVSPFAVMELVRHSNCSSYDCEFVALAKNLDTKLITYDKQILKEFPLIAFKPEDFLAQ
jgi:predicted nucleic acid-binding protein